MKNTYNGEKMNKVEEYLKELALPFEKKGETWIVQPRTNFNTRIGIRIEGPIITFTTNVVNIGQDKGATSLDAHRLLYWNANEMMHAAYGITGESLVLTGALEFENLDFNEFQGMIDDISMGVDTHFVEIRSWFGLETEKRVA